MYHAALVIVIVIELTSWEIETYDIKFFRYQFVYLFDPISNIFNASLAESKTSYVLFDDVSFLSRFPLSLK